MLFLLSTAMVCVVSLVLLRFCGVSAREPRLLLTARIKDFVESKEVDLAVYNDRLYYFPHNGAAYTVSFEEKARVWHHHSIAAGFNPLPFKTRVIDCRYLAVLAKTNASTDQAALHLYDMQELPSRFNFTEDLSNDSFPVCPTTTRDFTILEDIGAIILKRKTVENEKFDVDTANSAMQISARRIVCLQAPSDGPGLTMHRTPAWTSAESKKTRFANVITAGLEKFLPWKPHSHYNLLVERRLGDSVYLEHAVLNEKHTAYHEIALGKFPKSTKLLMAVGKSELAAVVAVSKNDTVLFLYRSGELLHEMSVCFEPMSLTMDKDNRIFMIDKRGNVIAYVY